MQQHILALAHAVAYSRTHAPDTCCFLFQESFLYSVPPSCSLPIYQRIQSNGGCCNHHTGNSIYDKWTNKQTKTVRKIRKMLSHNFAWFQFIIRISVSSSKIMEVLLLSPGCCLFTYCEKRLKNLGEQVVVYEEGSDTLYSLHREAVYCVCPFRGGIQGHIG